MLAQLKPTPFKQAIKSQTATLRPAQPCRVVCTAQFDARRAAGAALGVATALSLFVSPFPAQAVSGGGGAGNSLAFQDLSGQDLRKRRFVKADLRGADFTNANAEGVNFFGALAVEAKFVGTNLTNADLETVDFELADLSNAVMVGAQLTNAQFKLVKSIEGADFTDTLIRKDVATGLCKIAKGTNPTTGVSTAESLNCPGT